MSPGLSLFLLLQEILQTFANGNISPDSLSFALGVSTQNPVQRPSIFLGLPQFKEQMSKTEEVCLSCENFKI